MNVLWITNIIFPEAKEILTGVAEIKESGGWLIGSAFSLINNYPNIKLSVASVSNQVSDLKIIEGKKIRYYIIPMGRGNEKFNSEYDQYWIKIKNDFLPNIIHIHGTECSHGLSYINACSNEHVVVSIQGLTTYCSKYYRFGLSFWDIIKNMTIHDIIRGNIFWQQQYFKKRSIYEQDIIKQSNHIIGRTNWDRIHSTQINRNADYYVCNETLREAFYEEGHWSYETCNKHSIFLSQASYPLKGLHQLLKALVIVKKNYPDVIVRIAGKDITDKRGFKKWIRYSGYAKIINHIIRKNNLDNNIIFLGNLDSYEMKSEYLKANIFICPSSIENSSNSLGEAQILGVPVICSYVGGLPDMMKGNEINMYRFDEYEMLADIICRIFENRECQIDMSEDAKARHNKIKNAERLVKIYNSIINEDNDKKV